jgi:hypothetical protein
VLKTANPLDKQAISKLMALLLSFIGFGEGWLHAWLRRASTLGLLCFALTNVGGIAADVLPPGLTTNTVERPTTVESFAPVPVPEPSEKAVEFYRSGIVWWLLSEGWSWFVPALILCGGDGVFHGLHLSDLD